MIGIVVIFVMGYSVSSIIGIFTELLFYTFMLLALSTLSRVQGWQDYENCNKFELVRNILHFTNPILILNRNILRGTKKSSHDHVVHILLSNVPDNATCLSLVMSGGMSGVCIT